MNACTILHKELAFACPHIHKYRLNALLELTEAACHYQKCSLTGLGENPHQLGKNKTLY